MLLRKKTKSLIVVSLAIIGLASTSIVNARSLIASNTSLVQIESKGTHPTGSVTKGNYTVNSSILTKPSMGQAAARGILTVGSPKPAKDMGLSMTLWGTEYSLIAATPYYYNTNGTTAVSVTTRYADGYSTFTTGGDMKYNNLSSNWRFKQAKWISPYNKNIEELKEKYTDNDKIINYINSIREDILKNLDIPNKKLKEREYMYNEKGMILAKATNGIEGYVYEEEVRKDSSEERTINVYNKDGKVIGDFKIEFGEEE